MNITITKEGNPVKTGDIVWAVGISGNGGKPYFMPFRARVESKNDSFVKECFSLYKNAKEHANAMNLEKGYDLIK